MGKRKRKWKRETEQTSEAGDRIDKALRAEFGPNDEDWPVLFIMIKMDQGISTMTYMPEDTRATADIEAMKMVFWAYNTFYEGLSKKDKQRTDSLFGERPQRRLRDALTIGFSRSEPESPVLIELRLLEDEHAQLKERYDARCIAYREHMAIHEQNPSNARYTSLVKEKRNLHLMSRQLTQLEEQMKELKLHA